jgi:tRNA threonylcarbamoyladenosine biosynthesis protein TsaB
LKSKIDKPSLPIILALDTSSKRASMAVARGPHLLGTLQGEADEKRSERLWGEIDSLLKDAGLNIVDVDLYSVCIGPGVFTGLRVGIAAIKGFATANKKQVVGVTSLEAVALSAAPARQVFATVNAYKGEAYSQLFRFDGAGLPVAQEPPAVTTSLKVLERMASLDNTILAGDCSDSNAGKRLYAEHIAEIAFKRYVRSNAHNPEQVRACYVRPSEAEIKLSAGLLGSKIKRVMKQE